MNDAYRVVSLAEQVDAIGRDPIRSRSNDGSTAIQLLVRLGGGESRSRGSSFRSTLENRIGDGILFAGSS